MSVIVETIVIRLNQARKYTVTTYRGSLIEELGTIQIREDGLYSASSTSPKYHMPILWGNFERALAYLISPRGMT